MSSTGKYIYGVINTGSHAAAPLLLGLNGVYTVPHGDVSAIVNDSEILDYANLPADAAARCLVRHQLVIERIMHEFSIIPMRLGTYVLNEGEVMQVLTSGYRVFQDIFGMIENRIEIDVAASWTDMNAVIKEISEEEEVRALKQSLLDKKEGITVDDQMKMGSLIESHMDRKKDECVHTIRDSLKGLGRNTKEYAPNNDAGILNAAFLIDNGRRISFEEKLDELSNGFGGRVHFKCIGPLPPYSFYVLEVIKFRYEEIDQARKKLGLNEFETKDEIKRAHRRCASAYHPDRQFGLQSDAGKAEAEMEYDEIAKAYKLLSIFCQQESCSMKEEDFAGNSIIVRIREQ